jgi:hypothetical protein
VKISSFIIFCVLVAGVASADPDCSGVDRWPVKMAFSHLKNAGITDNDRLDWAKTRIVRIASQKIGKDAFSLS